MVAAAIHRCCRAPDMFTGPAKAANGKWTKPPPLTEIYR
jgi:hypothetical protein